ncbi:MAG: carbon-nitrogen hydrolase family protein [Alphaproteobacteria bacterium]|nr:carbon-nitrogen hydrolase family protein [Alphaproteobacteria bacterium]
MSDRKIRVACVQLRSTDDVNENIATTSALIRAAHKDGAQFIATPENTTLMAPDGGAKLEKSFAEKDDPAIPAFARLAEELGVWLLIGSLAIKVSETKTANRSFLFDPKGRIDARYDKVHLFDVNLPSGETYRESNTVAPGGAAVVANLPFARIGLSVCYDLRFPQLYRTLAKNGAEILTVPSAFTETTGKAHWHVLLRARAIENAAFVMAPAQGGVHANGRRTYGHSLIIGPWGDILADGGIDPGVVGCEIDLEDIAAARGRVPSLTHDRPFSPPV